MSTNPFKMFAYAVIFILMVIVPPFGIISGFLFIAVHYMSRNDDRRQEETTPEQKKKIAKTLEEYQEEQKNKAKAAKELSDRNRKRNLTIKSDVGGR